MQTDRTQSMRVAVFHGDKRISVKKAPIPQPGEGEVLVRVARTALCGSDIKLWLKGAQYTAGHEIFGTVAQPGHVLNGQRVVVYIPLHCGTCDACRNGDTQMCLTISSLVGWNRPGGYAEYLPVPENCLLPVPNDIEDSLAPLLLDTIGTSAHAVRFASQVVPPRPDDPVLVTGAGPVGLGTVLALREQGYEQVFISDPNQKRQALAVEFGAKPHAVGDTSRRFRLLVECSGAHAARDLAIELILPRGAIVLVGENEAPWTIQEDKIFRRKDFYMIRTFYFPKADLASNVELLRRHKTSYARLVDAEFEIDALPQGFAHFAAGELIKPVLAFAGDV